MPNITLSVPKEVYRKMRKYREVKWSEVVRNAIINYLARLEEGGYETTTSKLLEELGEEFRKGLAELKPEFSIEMYEKQREIEWRDTSTTQAS